ncbi:hypothetical protein [Streptomyces sp. NPDC046859]|uniref:hypothetical protein n=1 Tax=Streptomyces sp. NPDC046859 TaxID=3155734 RepID=UPI003407596A
MNGQDGRGRQDRADAVDREMAARLLPGPVVRALDRWWETNAAAYADAPGAHMIRYTPGRRAHITPCECALFTTAWETSG